MEDSPSKASPVLGYKDIKDNLEGEIAVDNQKSQGKLLQSEYDMLVIKLEMIMKKLCYNNGEISEIYKDEVEEYCKEIKNSMESVTDYIRICESVDENFNSIKALALKTQYFRNLCEGMLTKNKISVD